MRGPRGVRFLALQHTLLAALLTPGVAMLGCKAHGAPKPKPDVPAGGVLIAGAGATFPSLLYKQWFAAYHQAHPNTLVTYDAVGSGEGVRRFLGRNVADEDQVDFGASDAAMQDSDIARAPQGAVMLPVTAGGVALAYNLPEVPQDLKLSRRAYAGIFLGEIKTWNDPLIAAANPGVKIPRLTIATVVRQDSSGTTFAFTKHLDAISDRWRSRFGPTTLVDWPGNAMRAKGNEGVAGILQHADGAIGYVGYEFAMKYGLRIAILENKSGKYVKPSEESLRAALVSVEMPENLRAYVPDPTPADAYPIATFTWILLRKNYPDAQKAQALRALFSWALADGQQLAPSLGYVALPPQVVEKAQAALNTVTP
jgi:phosphate transport system substrate-binding protein